MCAARTHLWVLEHVRLVKNDQQEFHFLVENGGLCAQMCNTCLLSHRHCFRGIHLHSLRILDELTVAADEHLHPMHAESKAVPSTITTINHPYHQSYQTSTTLTINHSYWQPLLPLTTLAINASGAIAVISVAADLNSPFRRFAQSALPLMQRF